MSFLDDLKSGGSSVFSAAGNAVNSVLVNGVNQVSGSNSTVRTSNTDPTPDVTAALARANQGLNAFASSSVGGLPLPLLLIGGLGLALILLRRK